MTDLTAEASGGALCVGVFNQSSSPTMTNVAASGSGGSSASVGVYNTDGASPFMTNVTAFAYGSPGENVGLFNSIATSNPAIRHSFIAAADGTPYAIKVASGTVRVFHSSILGNIDSDPIANNLKCFYSDNGTLNPRDADCQLLPTPWP